MFNISSKDVAVNVTTQAEDNENLLSGHFEENPGHKKEQKSKVKFKAYGIHAGVFKDILQPLGTKWLAEAVNGHAFLVRLMS